MIRPFLPLLRGGRTSALAQQLEGIDPEHRLSAASVHRVIAASGDAALGLRASEHMAHGDGGLLDFLMTSAPTPRDALTLAHSHIRLLSDVQRVTLACAGDEARVCLEERVETPRAIDEFVLACLLRNHVLRWHPSLANALHVTLRRAPPQQAAPYQHTFGASLRFASTTAISFPAWYLDVPLPHRNRRLHAVLRRAADEALARLPTVASHTERVRTAIREQLAAGRLSLAGVARALGQHPRTLSRALLREGTTFQALVARTRHDAALHWLRKDELSLTEVARLSGFHSKAPFHRSFRRWTGETPQRYRRKQHGELPLR